MNANLVCRNNFSSTTITGDDILGIYKLESYAS